MGIEDIKKKLADSGLAEREVPSPGGSYVAVNIRGNIAYVAIQFPIEKGLLQYGGELGSEITSDQGNQAARIAAMNVIGQIEKFVGFEKIEGLNHVDIYYNAANDWDEGPMVADGASDLFLEIMGDAGKHTRAIFGVERLPRFSCVAMTASFTMKSFVHLDEFLTK